MLTPALTCIPCSQSCSDTVGHFLFVSQGLQEQHSISHQLLTSEGPCEGFLTLTSRDTVRLSFPPLASSGSREGC